MSMNEVALATTIILLFPMMYFLIASLTFFLRPFEDPRVTWLLRGLFNVYFLAIAVLAGLALAAFTGAGRGGVALGIGGLALLAVAARWWFLPRIDAQIAARDAGDGRAIARLRRLHLGGMAYNAVQFAAVIANIPALFPMQG